MRHDAYRRHGLSVPTLFLLIVIAAILHTSFWLIVFIVALAAWLVPARLIGARRSHFGPVSTFKQSGQWAAAGAGSWHAT